METIDQLGQHVHFIGIGGISMSGLAEILHQRGFTVTGSDRSTSENTHRLAQHGIDVSIGHKAGQEAAADCVIYNSAIPPDNPEYAAALAAGKRMLKRSQLLGCIMAEYARSIAISGTHGKTTTTSMLSTILVHMGQNPTVHNGSVLPLIGGATRVGGNALFVAEACEYQENFLDLHPTDAVILNVDADHLDYYRNIDHITQSFRAFVAGLPADGTVIVNGDDARALEIGQNSGRKCVTFGFGEGCTLRATDEVADEQGCFTFQLAFKGFRVCPVKLSVPGRHHIYNAMAAMAAAAQVGITPCDSTMMISTYTGAERRFEKKGEVSGAAVYHDYAHHPAEVQAALEAAALLPHRKLWCVFQPHTYSRTKALFDRFIPCFAAADNLLFLDIYAAREPDPGDISSSVLAQAVCATHAHDVCRYLPGFDEATAYLREHLQPGDLLLTLGAGDIEDFTNALVSSAL
ncbi:MAG: UDP-N-acetylmuramate--L-alanine ligase [Eubacteriales bacterium]|nr:UDP-N-acetylmuramate--L-alanine ligase [Eubacteriales bacterium]